MYHRYCKSGLVTLAAGGNGLYKTASNDAYWQIHVADVLFAYQNVYSFPYLNFFLRPHTRKQSLAYQLWYASHS